MSDVLPDADLLTPDEITHAMRESARALRQLITDHETASEAFARAKVDYSRRYRQERIRLRSRDSSKGWTNDDIAAVAEEEAGDEYARMVFAQEHERQVRHAMENHRAILNVLQSHLAYLRELAR